MEEDAPLNLFELDTDPPMGVRIKPTWRLNENSFEFVPLEPQDDDAFKFELNLQLDLELALKARDFGEVDPSELETPPPPTPIDFGEVDPSELERTDGSVEFPELY